MPKEKDMGEGAMGRMKARLVHFETEEGRLKGMSMVPRPTDVFIVTTPKAGTTWLQQITHQLRTKGDLDFDEITEVVPWVELAVDLGLDLDAEQKAQPRLFKTHCWYDHCPQGGRYIVVMRHPEDVAISFYRFFEGWFFERGEIDFESFAEEFLLERGLPSHRLQNASYWHHLVSWYQHKDDDNVLLLFYEDLKADLRGCVELVAKFMGYHPSQQDYEERVGVAVHHSTFDFMSSHASLFNEHMSKQARNEAMGLPRDAGKTNYKVRAGQVGSSASIMPDSIRQQYLEKWSQIVQPATGFNCYDDLRRATSLLSSSLRQHEGQT